MLPTIGAEPQSLVSTRIDSVRISSGKVLYNNNLRVYTPSGSDKSSTRTEFDGVSSGKYYWETVFDTAAHEWTGIVATQGTTPTSYPPQYPGLNDYSYGVSVTGMLRKSPATSYSTVTGYLPTCSPGDVVGTAMDLDNLTLNFSHNGTWCNAFTIVANTYFPACACNNSGGTHPESYITFRFSPNDLQYPVPEGYIAGFGELTT